MEVELRRHIGQEFIETHEGPIIKEVDLGQDRIFLDGRHVGFVNPDIRKALFIGQVDPPEVEAVLAAIREKYGSAAGSHQPMALPTELRVEEEGDE